MSFDDASVSLAILVRPLKSLAPYSLEEVVHIIRALPQPAATVTATVAFNRRGEPKEFAITIALSSLGCKTSQAVKAVQDQAAKIGKAVKFVLKPAVNN